MSGQHDFQSNHSRNVIAALQNLGAAPEGAENDPVLRALQGLGDAKTGRSESGPPLPASDRPSWEAFQRLERENRLLIDHAEMLACALGACPDCWGTIPDCEECGGDGRPGWYESQPDCFEHFVRPMLDRMVARAQVKALLERSRAHRPG